MLIGPKGAYIISAGQCVNFCFYNFLSCLQSIQSIVTELTKEELLKFKMWFYQWEPGITLQQVMEGDLLDFVDRILEVLGKKNIAIVHTVWMAQILTVVNV